jgi:hypothetical protein
MRQRETDAADQLDSAIDAYRSSSRPTVPLGAALLSSVAAGVGVGLLGQPFHGGIRVGALALALGLLLVAGAIPTRIRNRAGLHGYRGQVRRDNVTLFVCACALFVSGLGANATLGAIYVGIGLVVAVAWFLLLRNAFGLPRDLGR